MICHQVQSLTVCTGMLPFTGGDSQWLLRAVMAALGQMLELKEPESARGKAMVELQASRAPAAALCAFRAS